MKNIIKNAFVIVAASTLMFSCTTVLPVTATNNAIGDKVGRSSTTILFGFASGQNLGTGIVLNKNYGVIEAAKKGGLSEVATVDIKVTNYILFEKAEIIVTGN